MNVALRPGAGVSRLKDLSARDCYIGLGGHRLVLTSTLNCTHSVGLSDTSYKSGVAG